MARPRKSLTKSKTASITVRTDVTLKQRYENFAEQEHVDMADILRKALREWADQREAVPA